MHDWPAWLNPATATFAAAVAQSPDGSMISGALLPSSRPTFFSAALAAMAQPTSGEPVNVIRATSGCSTSGSPTVPPEPVTMLSQPGGRPHSSIRISCSRMADRGVWLAGLRTTGHPAAMAGATLWATRFSGKLNGEMAADHPAGHPQGEGQLPLAGLGAVDGHDLAGEGPGLDRRRTGT